MAKRKRNGRTTRVRTRELPSASLGYLRMIQPHEERLRSTDPGDTARAIAFLRGGRSGDGCVYDDTSGSFEAFSADFLAGDRPKPKARVPRTAKRRAPKGAR